MSLLDSLAVWTAQTANGAVTNESTLNSCLDLFFIAWASRNMNESTIVKMFTQAYNEDSQTALKILFWARDIRWGAGERRFFRTIWRYLYESHPAVFARLSKYVPEYGRWDDLFVRPSSITFDLIKKWLEEWNWLLAKWLPRKWDFAKSVCKNLWLTPRQYRKLIVWLTNVVETKMCQKRWSEISYQNIPWLALNKYRTAWYRNDEKRYTDYLDAAKNGKVKMNAQTLFPYQVYRNFQSWDKSLTKAQWINLPDYGWNGDILPVVDVSWSMQSWYGSTNVRPYDISVSLWVYLAEKIKWRFQDHFISFEWTPKLHKLSWDINDRFRQVERSSSDMSTNLQWVFELLLKVAKRDWLSNSDMPKKILIISDMEFNSCGSESNLQAIQRKYREAWYELPYLVFWNVNGREGNNPALRSEFVWMVSGASPSVVKWILSDNLKTPMDLMNEIIYSKRYESIV